MFAKERRREKEKNVYIKYKDRHSTYILGNIRQGCNAGHVKTQESYIKHWQ